MKKTLLTAIVMVLAGASVPVLGGAQGTGTTQVTPPAQGQAQGQGRRGGPPPTPEQIAENERRARLRGEYSRYRANNDLLYYHLDVRIDPATKLVTGKNTIRFRMLGDDTRIQLDLYANLNVDRIVQGTTELKYSRDANTVYVDFPSTLKSGSVQSIDFFYSGTPTQTGRFGGFVFGKDPAGRDWIYTACEGEGAAIWWPNKDQWRDEVENMDLSVSIPSALTDASNGRFVRKTDLGDGFTRWDWKINYPINNYNVSVNIAAYQHWQEKVGDVTMDFYVLPEDVERAKPQYAQAKGMMETFEHFFGEYPFVKDGYKLIHVPYTGMEHQSAVTYGNGFQNGYGGGNRDWTGVGISLKFDFIVVHESGHEWFGNAVSAADASDMWIQEGWCTYLEGLYVERMYGLADAIKYLNGYKPKIQNQMPIVRERGLHRTPSGNDQYFKAALMLNTLRSVVNDDRKWMKLLRDTYDTFKYKNSMTEDIVAFFNKQTGMNLAPIFYQYLRHTAIPVLELEFDAAAGTVRYRWKVDEASFTMPVRVGSENAWQTITPTTEWQTMKTTQSKESFMAETSRYFVNVNKSEG